MQYVRCTVCGKRYTPDGAPWVCSACISENDALIREFLRDEAADLKRRSRIEDPLEGD